MDRYRQRLGREEGESLLELLVAVALLGTAIVAVVFGLGTGILVSDVHRKQSTAGAEVRTFAEKVESTVAGTGYVPCAGVSAYAGVYTAPSGYTKSVTAVRYWNGTGWTATCGSDVGLQKLSLQVRSDDGRATESLDVVVRKPCAPGQTC